MSVRVGSKNPCRGSPFCITRLATLDLQTSGWGTYFHEIPQRNFIIKCWKVAGAPDKSKGIV